jgi:drug/metabolite transporter (DMT)-like permease
MTAQHSTLKAIALMLAAMAILPIIDVFAKFLGQQNLPVVQMVWASFFFGAIFTLPFAFKIAGPQIFRPSHPLHQSGRAAFLILGTICFFWSLKYLPIADTLAIYFVQPILVTALSPFLLGEKVGIRRWFTVVLGFIGVLIIIRPGLKELNPGVILAFGAGLNSASYILLTRRMTGSVNAMVTSFQTCFIGAIPLTLALPFIWAGVDTKQFAMLLGIGLIAILGHYMITRAYDMAEASLLSPLGYTEMINAVVCGYIFFGDFPDNYTFFGVTILIGCAIYISIRERQTQTASSALASNL